MFARGFLLLAATSAALGVRVLSSGKINTNVYKHVTPIAREHHAHELEFTIYLAPSDNAGLDARIEEIASDLERNTPWLTDQELGQYTKPLDHHLEAVKKHVDDLGIPSQDQNWAPFNEQVTLKVPAAKVSELFPGTELHLYEFKNSFQTFKAHEVHIPDRLSDAVTHVSRLLDFPVVVRPSQRAPKATIEAATKRLAVNAHQSKAAKRFGKVHGTPVQAPHEGAPANEAGLQPEASKLTGHLTGCDAELISAECVRHYYGTYDYTQNLKPNNDSKIDTTIFGYIGQNPSQADLTSYLKVFRPEAVDYQVPIEDVYGAYSNQSDPSGEPQLDIQLLVGQTWPLKTKYVNLGAADDPQDIFLQTFDWLLYHGGKHQRPGVISVSYGSDEDGNPLSGAHQMCNAAKKLSALGHVIAVSSGDNGVAGNGEVCALDGGAHPFISNYPVDCPHILSVGANRGFNGYLNGEAMVNITYLNGGQQEGFYSGAARSNIFPIPNYQRHDVEVLNRRLADSPSEPPYMYNASGRLYPDLVANGWYYYVVQGGQLTGVGGTSASAPTTAANLALINDALVKAGKSRLGWIHPLIYQHKVRDAAFKDIWQGGSFGCTPATLGNDYGTSFVGARAREGFDASAGLGSFRFNPLRKMLSA